MMKRIRLLLLVLAGLLILSTGICGSGCVKSEASPIYSENSTAGSGEEGSGQTAVPAGRYEAPERWTDSVSKDDLSVVVDAKVTVPDAEKFPVTAMSVDGEISQETADRIRETLLGDAQLYWNEPPAHPFTKQEIQDSIDENIAFLDTPDGKEYAETVQARIDTFERMYKDAPESFEPGPADTQFHEYSIVDNPIISLIAGTATMDDSGREASLRIERGNSGGENWRDKGRVFFDNRSMVFVISNDDILYRQDLESVSRDATDDITQEQAEEQALAAVRAMGLDYLEIFETEEQNIVDFEYKNDVSPTYTGIRPCYIFTLKRSVGGILENDALPRIPLLSEQDYEKIDMFTETAQICIAKEGIIYFNWSVPSKVVETESENVELMKFKDVQEIFDTQIILDNLQSAWDMLIAEYDLELTSRTITIDEARLGLMCVSRQIEDGGYLMIPVWDFYGYESLKVADSESAISKHAPVDENGELDYSDLSVRRSYLTLNAVDGSVINRTLGH